MIKKLTIVHIPESCSIWNTPNSSTISSTTTTSPTLMKRNLSVDYLSKTVSNMKKNSRRSNSKHTPISICSLDPITDEIENRLKLDVICEDVLLSWQLSGDIFPHLWKLAQIILAIPVTCTPSGQVFSTTCLILSAKRTMLSPESVGKIQMIHDNYSLLKPA